jgi:hypothetical protein
MQTRPPVRRKKHPQKLDLRFNNYESLKTLRHLRETARDLHEVLNGVSSLWVRGIPDCKALIEALEEADFKVEADSLRRQMKAISENTQSLFQLILPLAIGREIFQ